MPTTVITPPFAKHTSLGNIHSVHCAPYAARAIYVASKRKSDYVHSLRRLRVTNWMPYALLLTMRHTGTKPKLYFHFYHNWGQKSGIVKQQCKFLEKVKMRMTDSSLLP